MEAIFGPGIARRVMGLFSAQMPRSPQASPELTEREEEILTLIAGGHDNAEIADRVQAALRAREAGLGG